MWRRDFSTSVVAFVLGLLGIGKCRARTATQASFLWLKEQLTDRWEDSVHFAQVDCGAGTCPPGPEDEGFRTFIRTAKRTYCIVAKPDYLGCTYSMNESLPGGDWRRGSDLSDGKRTISTWEKIVADIDRVEKTGTKYALVT